MAYLGPTIRRSDDAAVPIFLVTAAVYGTLTVLIDSQVQTLALTQSGHGVALLFGVLFGVPAALGVAAGVVATDALQFGVTVHTLVDAVSLTVFAYVGHRIWQSSASEAVGEFDPMSVRSWRRLLQTAVVSAVLAASVLAWSYEIVGVFPFFVSFLTALNSYMLAPTLAIPPLVVVLARRPAIQRETGARIASPWRVRTITVLAGLWAAVALIGSIGFTIREQLPRTAFAVRDVAFLFDIVHPDLFGHNGRWAQIAFGVVVLVVGYALLRRTEGIEN